MPSFRGGGGNGSQWSSVHGSMQAMVSIAQALMRGS
jgi:hypothetical protein